MQVNVIPPNLQTMTGRELIDAVDATKTKIAEVEDLCGRTLDSIIPGLGTMAYHYGKLLESLLSTLEEEILRRLEYGKKTEVEIEDDYLEDNLY